MEKLKYKTTLENLEITNKHNSPETSLEISSYAFADGILEESIIVPVHNMESVIFANLDLLSQNASRNHEIIVILDSCKDASKNEIERYAKYELKANNLLKLVLIESSDPLFETTCDAVGFKIANSDWLIEVQSDMQILEAGWDQKLIRHLEQNTDIFCVSARGCHDWVKNDPNWRRKIRINLIIAMLYQELLAKIGYISASNYVFRHASDFGRCKYRIEANKGRLSNHKIFLGQTVMRGPLVFSRPKLMEIGGFDTNNYFLGNDDHELMHRAWSTNGWRCGYSPIRFKSPLEDGATRREKSPEEERDFQNIASKYQSRFAIPVSALVPQREIRKLSRNNKSVTDFLKFFD